MRPRRRLVTRRRLYWVGVLVAVVAVVLGTTLAVLGYQRGSSPADVVRGYFTALQNSDAPGALSYGDVPAGSHVLLTNAVLAEQHKIAPLDAVSVGQPTVVGDRAGVPVTYRVEFPDSPRTVTDTIGVHRHDGDWRLDDIAVSTTLSVPQADRRATILGGPVPTGPTLVFPGAAPITLDTPYLGLDPSTALVNNLTQDQLTAVGFQVTRTGHAQAIKAVLAALTQCLDGHGPKTCPLPDNRYLPDGLRGKATSNGSDLDVTMGSSKYGTLEVSGQLSVNATYRRLDFYDRVVTGKGSVTVPVRALMYATAPLRVVWARS